jgi:hypothetical protein
MCRAVGDGWLALTASGVSADHLLEPSVVRSMPVHVRAGPATGEVFLRAPGSWFELVCYQGFRNRRQGSSAGRTEGPWLQGGLEAFDHVAKLIVGVLSTDESGPAQGPTHQQPPVAAEQNSVLTSSLLDQMMILGVSLVGSVDAQ